MQLHKTLMGCNVSRGTTTLNQSIRTCRTMSRFASKYGDNTAAIRQKAHLQSTSDMSLIGHRQLLRDEASRMLKRICLLTYHRNQVSTQCIPCLCAHTHAQCRSSVGFSDDFLPSLMLNDSNTQCSECSSSHLSSMFGSNQLLYQWRIIILVHWIR